MASVTGCRACLRPLRQHARTAPPETSIYPRLISQPAFLKYSTRSRSSSSSPSPPIQSHRGAPILRNYTYRHASSSAAAAPTATPNAPPSDNTSDPRTSKPSSFENITAQETTETLFKECARQADYIIPQAFEAAGGIPKNAAGEDIGQGSGFWYDRFGLTPTFNTWAQVTFLYMYLLTVRLRYLEPARCAMWQQHLHDHFFFEAEHRMSLFHKIDSKAIRQRYLKDLYNQWRGVLGAYDEGLIRGDAVLGAAVWRNVFRAGQSAGPAVVDRGSSGGAGAGQLGKGDETGATAAAQEVVEGDPKMLKGARKEAAERTQAQEEADFDWRQVACVVAFVRRGLSRLDKVPDSVILSGKVKFGDPGVEWESVVGTEANGVKAKFEAVDAEALDEWTKGK